MCSTSTCMPTQGLPPDQMLFGSSRAMDDLRKKVQKIASASVPVLILGESGTGKESLAKWLHRSSPWAPGPFVKVSCPAIPLTLFESELFGYERGSFSGATESKPGRLELADCGTLFLDQIHDLDPSAQAKLLQILQDGQFCRIGGLEDRRVGVRLISASNRRLDEEIQAGRFRQDLFYRIDVLRIELPPLRKRAEDIPALAVYFVEHYRKLFERDTPVLSPSLLALLRDCDWPGNIRELENLIKRYVILGSVDVITEDLRHRRNHEAVSPAPTDGFLSLKIATKNAVRDLERNMIIETLHSTNWNRRMTAKILNISYRALLYKMRQAGLPARHSASVHVEEPLIATAHPPSSEHLQDKP
jgi:two-component system response regulator AtoC